MVGINYYLDRLPSGYQLMDYPKPGDESIVSPNIHSLQLNRRWLMKDSDTSVYLVTLAADSMTRNLDSSLISCG